VTADNVTVYGSIKHISDMATFGLSLVIEV